QPHLIISWELNINMIFALIAAWLAYKKAKATGRNAILWAFIAAATFIGTQFIIALGLGLIVEISARTLALPRGIYENQTILITIIAVVGSFVSTWALLRYLDRVPENQSFTAPPPPPPSNFNP